MPPSPHFQLLHPTVSPGTAAQSLHGDHPISAIACAPSRPLIALGNHHGTISIRNAQTGEELQQLDGHTNRIHECTFSPDSRWLLSASLDGTLLKWHLESGRATAVFIGTSALNTCDLDETRTITAGDDGRIRMWSHGKAITLAGHIGMTTTVRLHPDGRRLISGGVDGSVMVWDPQAQSNVQLYQHRGAVTAVRITPDGGMLISAGTEGRIKVWDLQRNLLVVELSGHDSPITSCALHPDGQRLVSGAIDRTVVTWDLSTGTREHTFTSHSDAIMSVAWGERIWSVSEDCTARAWNPTEQPTAPDRQLRHHDGVSDAIFCNDQLITASTDCTLRTWDVRSGACAQVLGGALGAITAIDLSANQRMMAAASTDGFARLYHHDGHWRPGLVLHTGAITSATFLSDHTLLTGGPDRPMQVWSLLDGCSLFALGEEGVSDCVILEEGDIVSVDAKSPPIHWSSGEKAGSIGEEAATAIAAHPDAQHIALGRSSGAVEVWDLHRNICIHTHAAHSGPVNALAFLPDGRVISSATDDDMVVWSPEQDRTTTVPTHGTIQTITAQEGRIAAGDEAGNVWLFTVCAEAVRSAA
jgi:WD40 repeat protein